MTTIEKIQAEMLSISKKTKLPEFYAEDLSQDLSLVETFSGHKVGMGAPVLAGLPLCRQRLGFTPLM